MSNRWKPSKSGGRDGAYGDMIVELAERAGFYAEHEFDCSMAIKCVDGFGRVHEQLVQFADLLVEECAREVKRSASKEHAAAAIRAKFKWPA